MNGSALYGAAFYLTRKRGKNVYKNARIGSRSLIYCLQFRFWKIEVIIISISAHVFSVFVSKTSEVKGTVSDKKIHFFS